MYKLLKNLKPFALSITIVLILVFFQSMSDLYLPNLMSDIVNTGIVKGDTNYILRTGGFMLLVAFGGMICVIIASYLSSKIAVGFARNLRDKVFNQVEEYSLNEFDKFGTATLITRTTNDITQIQQVLVIMMRMVISAPMMCIGGIIMALSENKKLTLVFVVVLPLIALFVYLAASKGVPLFKLMQVKLDKLNLVLRENLTGIRVIRAFNRIDHEKRRFNNANLDLTDTAIKVNKLMAALMPLMMLIMNFTTIAILWFGGKLISTGDMQVGDLMAFIQYAMQIMISLVMLAAMFVLVPRAEASAIRINEVLETSSDIKDVEKPKRADSQKGYIEFDNVTFSYSGAEQPALSNISFSAKPGEMTAIIGGTGSGKSTLIRLIPRFYDIDSGSIKIDGVDIREMTQEELRSKIGYVPQKSELFTGTVSDNIRYGREDASDEEVKHAADVAQATEFISDMNDGFDSIISQGGTNVSGGQKQRLSIARALVRKPEVYVFDDSFSALDFKTDAKLRAALKKETVNSAVIIVAQRISTVMNADRIVVLDDGHIAGIGKHRELLKTCEVYHEIASSQLSEEELA